MDSVMSIRYEVFIDEQGFASEDEADEFDGTALHVLALAGDKPVGCGRIYDDSGAAHLGRLAVKKEYRKCGAGSAICGFLAEQAAENGYKEIVVHAQMHAEGFYEKQGFVRTGEVFKEAGADHIKMIKELL